MCQTASFVLTENEVFFSSSSDSHEEIEEIIEENKLKPDGVTGPRILRVELFPEKSLLELETWKFKIDQDPRPTWFKLEKEEARTRSALISWWRCRWDEKTKTLSAGGDLNLTSLTSLAEGVTLSAGRGLILTSLTSLPKGVTLSAGRGLILRSLTSLPKGVTLSAGWGLDLSSLTSLPKGVTLSAGWDLYLSSLTSLPKGVTLSAGRDLILLSLTSLPKGVTLSAGGDLYLSSLTSLPKGFDKAKIKGTIYLKS
jgi:hypothetical protein